MAELKDVLHTFSALAKSMIKNNTMNKAFLFDLNGTMINDMEFHLKVWNEILNEDLKAGLTLDQVKQQMFLEKEHSPKKQLNIIPTGKRKCTGNFIART